MAEVTITLDEEVLAREREVARARGRSLEDHIAGLVVAAAVKAREANGPTRAEGPMPPEQAIIHPPSWHERNRLVRDLMEHRARMQEKYGTLSDSTEDIRAMRDER